MREFAQPLIRRGSIDPHSGYGRSALDGIEIHQEIQKKTLETDEKYQAEVSLRWVFERDGYSFDIQGRMDGLYAGPPVIIEEIKSTPNLVELHARLEDQKEQHPYWLQLQTYGYFYALKNAEAQSETIPKWPKLRLLLVSSRNYEKHWVDVPFDRAQYETWLQLRLDQLLIEAQAAERRSLRRKAVSQSLAFPFDQMRQGQVELIETVAQAVSERSHLLVEAPTGLGKTLGVMYPSLKDSLSRGQQLIYVTPKNTQHAVAMDAIQRLQERGGDLSAMKVTAKSKICMKAEPLCNPKYCEYAKDHYTKVDEHKVLDRLAEVPNLSTDVFKQFAEDFEVCPFELQVNIAAQADAIVCDYNYVFAERAQIFGESPIRIQMEGKPNLVIDEAHNLPSRAMDYFSPSLSVAFFEQIDEDLDSVPKRFAIEARELVRECIELVRSCAPADVESRKNVPIEPDLSLFIEQDQKLRPLLSRYVESDVEIAPKDPVLRLCFYWSQFVEIYESILGAKRDEFFVTWQPDTGSGSIKITCADASSALVACYDHFESVVGFSATLRPFEYYAKLSGLSGDKLRTAEFASPFPKQNRKVLVIPQVSTKFSVRERNYSKIAEAIHRISAVRAGNYLAFFPSFSFLDRVLECFTPPDGFKILRQARDMSTADQLEVLKQLRDSGEPLLFFCVQGGVFSEGIDYAGDQAIGVFVVGTALPVFDAEREMMRGYYEKKYQMGFNYAYVYPAMAKAVQAAGRVIRSETDRGIIVLMDDRFLVSTYTDSLPRDWFEKSAKELVSSSILSDLTVFWQQG